jgi:hypothetical protein
LINYVDFILPSVLKLVTIILFYQNLFRTFVHMKGHTINKDEIESFNIDYMRLMLSENPVILFENLIKMADRKLKVTEMGIGFDRKLLYSWKQHGLLPFSHDDKSWNRFSFIETCWLKILLEYRSIGVGIEKLKILKEFFFKPNFIEEFIEKANALIDEPSSEVELKKKLGITKKVEISDEILTAYNSIQLSLFSLYLYSIIMTRANHSLVITADGKIEVIDLNLLISDSLTEMPKIHSFLSDNTIACVNIRKVILELSGTHEYFSKTEVGAMVSENSVNALRNLFLDNKVKEVTIRISENGVATATIKKDMDLAEMQKEIYDLRRKGNFKDVVIKTRDGNIQYFEQTELIKL